MSKAIIDFEKGDISALKEISDALQTIIDKEGSIAEQWKQVLTAMNKGNATAAASTTKVAQGIEQITSEQKNLAAQVNTTGTVTENQNKSNIASNKKLSDSIDEVAQSQKEVAAQTKTTGASLDNQNKTNIDGTNKLAQSIEQMAVASKSMDKVVIGGAYKNYLKQIQDQLSLTGKELINYVQNARKAAQAEIFNPSNSKERIDELTLSIKVMNDALKSLGVNEDGTSTKTQSLRSRIKEAKDELVAMAEAGLQGTPAFEALQQKAGQLDDQMRDLNASIKNTGSDTKNIDGVISLMTGVAAGYSVAQGATALFGDENEEVTQSLRKLMAAMNILNGLQQFALVIQKESAASILFTKTARVAETAAIEGETVAQEGLNTAMEANPVGLIIIGLTALIAVISTYESSENKSAEATKKLNDLLSEQYSLSNDLNNIYPSLNQKLKENIDLQLKILEATNAPLADQIKKKQEIAAISKEIAQQEVDRLKKENGALEDNQKKLDEIDKKLLDYTKRQAEIQKLKAEFADKGMEITAAEAGAINAQIDALEKIPSLSEKSVDALKSQQSLLSKVVSDQKAANVVLNNAISDTSTLSAQELQKQFTDGLRSATAFADALVTQRNLALIKNQADSIASIKAVSDAEIAAIRQKQKEDLKSNSNLTAGEKAKINADADLAVALNKKKLQQDIDNSELAGIQAKLTLAKAGSLEEYNYKIELINKTEEQELSATQLTQNQIDAIYAKHQKERQDVDRLFEQSKLQDQISLDNADIDRFGISEHDKLLLTLTRLNDQEKLEISQANGNQKKIAEIEAKYNKLFKDTEISSNAEMMNKKITAYQVYHDERMKMDQQIASNEILNENIRINALKDLQTQQLAQVDIEMKTNQDNFDNHLILQEDFNQQFQSLLNKKRDISQNIEQQITQIEKQEIDV
jgi:hypothetical protein